MTDFANLLAVKSDHPEHVQGYFLIAKWDFDPEKHTLFEGPTILTPVAPPPGPPVPPPPPGAPDPLKDLAADWKSQSSGDLRKLAYAVLGRAVDNKEQAIAEIEKALAARG